MFKAFTIRNFRAFRTLKVDGLGKINLITGKNGTGKTAFLEAVFLNSGATNTSLCYALENFRGNDTFSHESDFQFRNLFNQFSIAKPIELIADWQEPSHKTVVKRTLTISPMVSTEFQTMQSGSEEFINGLEYSFRGAGTKTSAKIYWKEANSNDGQKATQGISVRIPLVTASDSEKPNDESSADEQMNLFVGEAIRGRSRGRQMVVENPKTTALKEIQTTNVSTCIDIFASCIKERVDRTLDEKGKVQAYLASHNAAHGIAVAFEKAIFNAQNAAYANVVEMIRRLVS